MIIESQVIKAGISADSLFDSLKNPARLEEFLPSNQVSDFTASESGCSFKVTGGVAIGIEQSGVKVSERTVTGLPVVGQANVLAAQVDAGIVTGQNDKGILGSM